MKPKKNVNDLSNVLSKYSFQLAELQTKSISEQCKITYFFKCRVSEELTCTILKTVTQILACGLSKESFLVFRVFADSLRRGAY